MDQPPFPSRRADSGPEQGLRPNPLWFREAVIYEIPVRAFADSNGDGIGDLPGLVTRLDYLADLGINAIWLLPFYPSPMRDGGYDIADYTTVNPVFGTLDDFKRLLDEAHRRGIRVITELVINHTSKDHPWFERARRSPPGSRFRDYYVWSDTPDRYTDARVIFKDFETSNWSWDPVAKAYYWHRFYSHQPDLNFDNPEVHEAIFKVCDFWFDLGVDGMRLDAVPYLYEREGTNCENLPETHAFLRQLRAHVDARYRDRMLLAEANQWPVDAAAYFGAGQAAGQTAGQTAGDECHMNFHFPLMPRLFMALQLEDRFPIVDILRQTPPIPEGCQWATFLRNHDELTLEMVTDQDRDYMYKVYAEDPTARLNLGIRRRLAPLLRSRQRIELVNGLLFSLPGTPVLYYGDEIGMGDNIYLADRDGVRTPMQWSADRNAGFSRANPQKLYLPVITDPEYHYEALNVEAQSASQHSLLWWTKRLIAMAKQNRVLGTGAIEFLHPENHKILAYLRTREQERVLVVANLSRFPQYVELDLAAHEGLVPTEIFSNVHFPAIGKHPYLLTLSPHTFFWFRLEAPSATAAAHNGPPRLVVAHEGSWREIFSAEAEPELASALLRHALQRRWFRSKTRNVKEARILDRVPLGREDGDPVLVLLELEYVEGDPEIYTVPLVLQRGEEADRREQRSASAVVARVEASAPGEGPAGTAVPLGTLFDAFATGDAAWPSLLAMAGGGAGLRGQRGRLTGERDPQLDELVGGEARPAARVPDLEQTNSVAFVAERAVVKAYRMIEPGPNSELEMGQFLSRSAPAGQPRLVPRLLGALHYEQPGRTPALVALAQEAIPNEGDAWSLTIDEIELYFDRVLSDRLATPPAPPPASLVEASRTGPPPELQELCGRYFSLARQLGQRTADVHHVLAAATEPAFAPEPFTAQHQQSIFQWSHVRLVRTFETLRRRLAKLPAETRALATALVPEEHNFDDRLRRVVGRKIEVARIRCHGDLHLGQVLFTGDDFVIIDFEGEPARPTVERRYKRCAMRDAMGMYRSFSYVSEAVLRSGRVRPEDVGPLQPWAEAWTRWVGAVYLGAYLQRIAGTPLAPRTDELVDLLLDFYELEKVIYEVEYELNNRPDWLHIPLTGLTRVLQRRPHG
jgi:maltose alpha-D-glucosyltransferase / alpha-amylase